MVQHVRRASHRPSAWLMPVLMAAVVVRCGGDKQAVDPETPPAAPSAVGAVGVSSTQVNLTWTDHASNEDGFRVERCTGAGCTSFAEITTLGANVTGYLNSGLSSSTTYTYRVQAYNSSGNSPYSNVMAATTQSAAAPPPAPTDLTVPSVSTASVNLSWTDHASNETGFRIERCQGPACSSFAEVATVGANVTTHQNAGLASGTTYNFRVRAYNGDGNSGYSNTVGATTQTTVTVPAAPTNLSAPSVTATSVNLAWVDNASNETGFRIERCTGSGCTGFVEITTVGANIGTYQDAGRASGTTYTYRVRAYNTAGNSDYSNAVAATTQTVVTVPPAPSNLTATPFSNSRIDLSWTDNSTNETGFRVEQCVGASCTNFVELGTVGASVNVVSITGLTGGTAYRYQVRAYNGAGNSGYSNIAGATTPSSEVEQTFVASFDNLVMYNSRDASKGNTVFGNADNIVGYQFYYDFEGNLFGYIGYASLLKFDVQSQIAGKTILEARLVLYQYALPGDPIGTFRLAAVLSSWNPSSITWNIWQGMSYYLAGTTDFAALPTTAVPLEFDVTQIVQNWANGTFANNGFQIWDPAVTAPGYESYQTVGIESREVYNNLSRRPALYIRWR